MADEISDLRDRIAGLELAVDSAELDLAANGSDGRESAMAILRAALAGEYRASSKLQSRCAKLEKVVRLLIAHAEAGLLNEDDIEFAQSALAEARND